MFTYCTQSAQAEHMFNEARTITSVPAVACNSHMRQITTLLWSGGLFLYHSLKVWKILRSHTPSAFCACPRSPFQQSEAIHRGEDVRTAWFTCRTRTSRCPASSCFTVSAHSLTHACTLPSTETLSGSFTCTCPHKQISSREDITAFLKMSFWMTLLYTETFAINLETALELFLK